MSPRARKWTIAAAVFVILWFIFANPFRRDKIEILHQSRPTRGRDATHSAISFSFTQRLKLTQVKVVKADELKTNKYPHALWHMVGEPTSKPIKGFMYGEDEMLMQAGMKSKIPNVRAEPLEPGEQYVMIVQTERGIGQTNFTASPRVTMAMPK